MDKLNNIPQTPQSIIVFTLDKEYRYLHFNQNHFETMKQIWGVDIEHGKSMLDYIGSKEDREKAKSNFDRTLAGDEFSIIEDYGDEKLGRFTYEDFYSPLMDADANIIGLNVTVIDITERKLREEAVQASEDRFRSIIEGTLEGIVAYGLETEKIIYANPAALELFGYSIDEIIELSITDIHRPEDLPKIQKKFKEVLKGKNAEVSQIPFINKNKEVFHANLKTNQVHINNQNCLLIYLENISTQVESKSKIEFQNELINAVGQAVIATDTAGRIVFWNSFAEELYKWKRDEVYQKTFWELLCVKNHQSELKDKFKNIWDSQKIWSGDIKVKDKRGKNFTCYSTLSPIVDSSKNLIGVVSVSSDISERIDVQKQTEEAERRYRSVISSLSEGLVVHGLTGEIVFANDSAAEILGLTMDQLTGKDSFDPRWESLKKDGSPFSPEEHPAMMTLNTGKAFDNVIMNVSCGEMRKVISINSRPIIDDKGSISGAVASFTDITEREKSRERLIENQSRIKNISDSVPGAVLRYKLNPDGTDKLLFINQGAENLYELTVEEMLQDVNKIWSQIFKEDFPEIQKSIAESGEKLTYWDHEWRIKTPSGKIKWLNGRGFPFRSNDGSIIWDTLTLDITDRKEMMIQLDENQKFMESINQNINEGIYRSNEKGVIYVNKAFLRMFGFQNIEEVKSQSAISIYKNPQVRTDLMNKLINYGKFQDEEVVFIRKDGSEFTGLISSSSYRDKEGNHYWDGAIRDITIERDSALQIEESQKLLESINRNINEAIYRSESGKGLIYVNHEFVRMFGYSSEEELLSINPAGLYKHSADREALGDELIETSSYLNKEVEFRRKDGSTFWGSMSSIKLEAGGRTFFDGAIRDISLQKKAEQSLKDQADVQNLLRLISSNFINLDLENIKQTVDESLAKIGEFAQVDRAYVFDFDLENKRSRNTYEWCNNGIASQIENLQNLDLDEFKEFSEIFERGEILIINSVADSKYQHFKEHLLQQKIKSLVCVPIMTKGKCIGFVGFDAVKKERVFGDREVTLLSIFGNLLLNLRNRTMRQAELSQLMNTMSDQNQRLKEFSFMTSHNIRSSVSNLLGLTKLLMDEPTNLHLVELLNETSNKLDTTIKNINQLLHLENKFKANEIESCNVHEIVQRILKLNTNLIEEKEIIISVNIPQDLNVMGIPAFMDSIFYNIISNAFKYGITRNSKTIEMWSKEKDEELEIYIKDMGWGIDLEKYKEKLFKLGSRLHQSSDGQGLGLYMTKHQIEEMGGSIHIESEPNVGTTFRLCFPKQKSRVLDALA